MARHEADREDLFAEALALARRVALDVAGQEIVIGFRTNERLSIYFGQDFMLTFGADDGLRRAYQSPYLYRAETGRKLARLHRERVPGETRLVRSDLDETALMAFLESATEALENLRQALDAGSFAMRAAVPEGEGDAVLNEIRERLGWLLLGPLQIADGMESDDWG